MKKSILLTGALLLSMAFASCNKDEESSTSGSLEGKWAFSKFSLTQGGITTPEQDYDNEPGCNKDYAEFVAGGVYHAGVYETGCVLDVTTGTWVRNSNTLTLSVTGEDDEIITITSLNDTQLKGKQTITDGTDTYTVNLILVKE